MLEFQRNNKSSERVKTFDQDVKMLIKIGRKGKKRERAVKEILRFAQNDGESEVTDQNRQRG